MRRTLSLIGAAALTTVALLLPPGAAAASPTTTARAHPVLAFVLVTPNIAVAPNGGMMASPGDRIEVTGGGAFAPATGTVRAGGRFTHRTAGGVVHCRGDWSATALTSWIDFGGRRGIHGGVVSMLVTHRCATTGEVHTDIPMTVTSTREAPPGSTYVDGTTVGDFTQPIAGAVVILGR